MSIKSYLSRGFHYIISGVPVYHTTVEVKLSSPRELLKDRKIIITGGNRGLGYVFARKCLSEGAQVVITGRNREKLVYASNNLGCEYIVLDSSNTDNLDSMFNIAEEKMGGKVDGLICNAGISLHEGDFRNVTVEGWDKQMDTNLKGTYFLIQAYIRYLESKDDKKGDIVAIVSERARRSDDIPYGLTKIATSSFIQSIAKKVISEGIRINGVGPGVTATDMTEVARDGDYYSDWAAGKRFFMPEEVAEVVNFLLSDLSACIAGEIITCDQASWVLGW